jgi:hypothetical protein
MNKLEKYLKDEKAINAATRARVIKDYIKLDKMCSMLNIISTLLLVVIGILFVALVDIGTNYSNDALLLIGNIVCIFILLFCTGAVLNLRDTRIKEIKRTAADIDKRREIMLSDPDIYINMSPGEVIKLPSFNVEEFRKYDKKSADFDKFYNDSLSSIRDLC